MADISKLSTAKLAEEGAPMVVRDPVTGEKTDIVFYLRGIDSTAYRQKEAEFRRRALKEKIDDPVAAADQQAMAARIACTVGWTGMEKDGKELVFSADAALELYSDTGYRWLIDLIDAFIRDRANFFQKP